MRAWRAGKDVVLLHVGDHDPSGEDIYRDVVETLRLYSMAVKNDVSVAIAREIVALGISAESSTDWMEFKRIALTPEQVDAYDLPVRPPKASDVRTAGFTGKGAVEVEALLVDVSLSIVEDAIVDLIDPNVLAAAKLAEESEREVARRIASTPVERLIEASAA